MNPFFPKKQPLKEDLIGLQLLNAYSFWSRKRIVFNVVVAIAAISATLVATRYNFYLDDLIGAAFILVVSNILYGLGYGMDSFIIVKSNGQKSLGEFRMIVFSIGMFLYALATGILVFFNLATILSISC